MRIAFDAELLYNEGLRNPGNIELVNSIYCMDERNEIYILADTIAEAKRISRLSDIDGITIAEQRTGYGEETEMYFARKDALPKVNVKAMLRAN